MTPWSLLILNGNSSEVRSPSGSQKTSDFFEVKFRCFASKVWRFASKKSDVFSFRSLSSSSLPKKFSKKNLHFLHQSLRTPLFIGIFGWRIGCRIRGGCRMNPTFSLLLTLFLPLFCPQYPAFLCYSVPNTAQNCSIIDSFLNNSSAKHSKWILLYWRPLLWTNKVLCGRLYLTISYTISCKTGRKVSQKGAVGVG